MEGQGGESLCNASSVSQMKGGRNKTKYAADEALRRMIVKRFFDQKLALLLSQEDRPKLSPVNKCDACFEAICLHTFAS
jgi:hypothetical protein